MKNEILRMERITTIQNEVIQLDNLNLHIFQGEIMGLVCMNENGKESLISLISRNVPIHYGRVYFNGQLVNNYQHSPLTMNKAAVIEQKSRLIDDLTVADNVFVLRRGFRKYLIQPRVLNDQLARFTREAGISLDGGELAGSLSQLEKYEVELLRAVVMDAKLIVIRNVSNSMSAVDLVKFHGLLRHYSGQGFSFLYICNHHEEALKICTRISLMCDGKILKVFDRNAFLEQDIKPFYMGQFEDIPKDVPAPSREEPVLSFRGVSTGNLDGLSFSVQKGQCTVVLDMDSTSLHDILGLMDGSIRPKSGEILFRGRPFTHRDARRPIANGIAIVAENPAQSMLFMQRTYLENLCFLAEQKEAPVHLGRRVFKSVVQEYEPIVGEDIHAAGLENLRLRSLYDLVYYRIHLCRPALVLCVQPFAGADMYLRRHVLGLIEELKNRGITVVIPSVSIGDSLVVADKLILLEKGRFSGEYSRPEFYRFQSEGIVL
jgi:ABC-type sugar transport system, ATPase component